MVDIASIFMRALTSFLNPTVPLDLGQSIITHFSFKWKFSRLVISSIMHCSHLKDHHTLQLRHRWIEMFTDIFFLQATCRMELSVYHGYWWMDNPSWEIIMPHTLGLIYCIIIFTNAMLVHIANDYWNFSLDLNPPL